MMFNTTVLMSGVEYFADDAPINPFMDKDAPVDRAIAKLEHARIRTSLESIGVNVKQIAAPENCQDGVFTANWALVKGDLAVLARLPNARKGEEAYAKQALEVQGKTVIELPAECERFSGQGDALPCGKYLFAGSGYRSDKIAQQFVAEKLGYTLVQLHTKPQLDANGRPVVNVYSGWEDSFFYDIDLAVSVLKPPLYDGDNIVENGLIGYCPAAFDVESVELIRGLPGLDLIEVSEVEAVKNLACNLLSTGTHVVMNDAPEFAANIEAHGLKTIRLDSPELAKGGGSVRCTTLTLY